MSGQWQSPCPRCNSWQEFHSKHRKLETLPWNEVYIRCLVCKYELVIGYTTEEIEMLRMRAKGIRERMHYEISRHGLPSQSTLNSATEVARLMTDAFIKLSDDMEAINGKKR